MNRSDFDHTIRAAGAILNGIVAWCLELHDLWLAKAVAGRPKDIEFCQAFVREGHVDPIELRERFKSFNKLADPISAAVLSLIERCVRLK